MRDRVDQSPGVAEAAEKFRRIDAALQSIVETVAGPVRTSDAYRAAEQRLANLREKRELTAQSGSASPDELAALLAQEQSVEFDMQRMMSEALNASAEFREAKAAADDASRALGVLRDKHAAAIADDPTVRAAREASAAAKDLLGQKNKQLAEARDTQSAARTEGRRLAAAHANAAQRVKALENEIKGLDYSIQRLRKQIDD
jgi:chromosome segregation ATPase